jgi:hypothetical protein
MGTSINWPKMLGQSIFYSSIQAAIGSVEMSSKFSIINFCKDQETLQNAADSLKNYMFVAVAWTVATMLVMYSQYTLGLIVGLILVCCILDGYFSYIYSFKVAAKKYGLEPPKVFF